MITTCAYCRGGVANDGRIVRTPVGWVHSECASGDGPARTGETVTNHRHWYVSVRDPQSPTKRGFLLGPYPDFDTASGHVERGRRLAESADPWSCFYAYGVASSNAELPTVFGV